MKTISLRIAQDEYDAIRAIIKDDPEFPGTYDGWLEYSAQQDAKLLARNLIPDEVIVNAQDLADYCRSTGLDPSLTVLHATAVQKARGRP